MTTIEDDWDLDDIVEKLLEESWIMSEKNRIDRMVGICSLDTLKEYTGHLKPQTYVDKMAKAISELIDEKNIYGGIDENDVFIGQFVEGDMTKLKKKFDILEDDGEEEEEEDDEEDEEDWEEVDWDEEDEEEEE